MKPWQLALVAGVVFLAYQNRDVLMPSAPEGDTASTQAALRAGPATGSQPRYDVQGGGPVYWERKNKELGYVQGTFTQPVLYSSEML